MTNGFFAHPLSGFLLLLKLPDVLLHHVGPEVALKVGKLRWRLDVVLEGLLVDVFVVEDDPLDDALVQHLLVPLLQERSCEKRTKMIWASIGKPGVSLVLGSSALQGGSGRCNRPPHWEDKPRCGPLCTRASSCSPGNLRATNISCILLNLESQRNEKICKETDREGSRGRQQSGSVSV